VSGVSYFLCTFAHGAGEKSRADDAWLIELHLTKGVWKTLIWDSSFMSRGGLEQANSFSTLVALHTLWRVAFLVGAKGSRFPDTAPQVKCIRMASRHFCVLTFRAIYVM
jgi:hypothetical protein